MTAWLQDIPLMFQALELPLKYIIIYKYTQIYIYTAKLVLDDEICLIPIAKPEPADNWNFLFPTTLGCTTELWTKNKNELSLQTFSRKRSGQHLQCWDTSNKPAISSSCLSYCNPPVKFFFVNYHEVASKLQDEKQQPLCATAVSN